MSVDVFKMAHELSEAGEAFVVATVVRAESPTSAKPGNKAVITQDGRVFGWVGGSCAEPTVRKEAVAALADGQSRLVHLSPEPVLPASRSGLTFVPMPCFSGGTMEIYVEPHVARPHLLVFGNSPVAHALAELAEVMRYRVTVVDLSDRPPFEATSAEVVASLDEIPPVAPESTFAVVASHGMFDEEAIAKALALAPTYLGLVTSPRRYAALRGILGERGVDEEALEKIHAPAGLDLPAREPHEIALSILAQILELRRDEAPAAVLDEEERGSKIAVAEPSESETEAAEGGGCCGGP